MKLGLQRVAMMIRPVNDERGAAGKTSESSWAPHEAKMRRGAPMCAVNRRNLLRRKGKIGVRAIRLAGLPLDVERTIRRGETDPRREPGMIVFRIDPDRALRRGESHADMHRTLNGGELICTGFSQTGRKQSYL